MEKLHDQLAQASPTAVQLMAELHVVHFLMIWSGAISAAKKCSTLTATCRRAQCGESMRAGDVELLPGPGAAA